MSSFVAQENQSKQVKPDFTSHANGGMISIVTNNYLEFRSFGKRPSYGGLPTILETSAEISFSSDSSRAQEYVHLLMLL